ncbi:hypothetical protein [Bdellovibrio bacteriovorus]|uniref:Lipoprotein n=1 Tax=Bdellovibrio bacteriovorus str. Tiberius TaxID=1069642 RepID=K7YNU7_BDEBC|nr:hypothetical protein [Bdellovibrio bacteriovorus]AFY01456.1 hypothetical protein Bdt_1766 [Bdellovibrio bacteriovorus str. Tiberius]
MKTYHLLLIAALTLTGCTKVEEEVPSIKAEFQQKYEFVMASFDSTIRTHDRESTLAPTQQEFLNRQLNELKAIIPLRGMTDAHLYDSLTDRQTLRVDSSQVGLVINRVNVWQLCGQMSSLGIGSLQMGGYSLAINASPSSAYTVNSDYFNYDAYTPQYQAAPQKTIAAPAVMIWENTVSNPGQCYSARVLVEYGLPHEAVKKSLIEWRQNIAGIQGRLEQLTRERSPENYPLSHQLMVESQKLKEAFDKLP